MHGPGRPKAHKKNITLPMDVVPPPGAPPGCWVLGLSTHQRRSASNTVAVLCRHLSAEQELYAQVVPLRPLDGLGQRAACAVLGCRAPCQSDPLLLVRDASRARGRPERVLASRLADRMVARIRDSGAPVYWSLDLDTGARRSHCVAVALVAEALARAAARGSVVLVPDPRPSRLLFGHSNKTDAPWAAALRALPPPLLRLCQHRYLGQAELARDLGACCTALGPETTLLVGALGGSVPGEQHELVLAADLARLRPRAGVVVQASHHRGACWLPPAVPPGWNARCLVCHVEDAALGSALASRSWPCRLSVLAANLAEGVVLAVHLSRPRPSIAPVAHQAVCALLGGAVCVLLIPPGRSPRLDGVAEWHAALHAAWRSAGTAALAVAPTLSVRCQPVLDWAAVLLVCPAPAPPARRRAGGGEAGGS